MDQSEVLNLLLQSGHGHITIEAFIEALRMYGPTEVTKFLIELSSKGNWRIDRLLLSVPTAAAMMGFHGRMIPFNVDPMILERCLSNDPDYLKRNGIL